MRPSGMRDHAPRKTARASQSEYVDKEDLLEASTHHQTTQHT